MQRFIPEKIFIEESAADLVAAKRVRERCSESSVEIITSAREFIRLSRQKAGAEGALQTGLLLCRNKGRFLEPCPGTKKPYRCCGYAILNSGTGCPLHCTYCVLQAYLNNPFITLYVNHEDMLEELEHFAHLYPDRIMRIGTGEYTDSLALEHLTDFTCSLLPFLRQHQGIVLELKTKTAFIDTLLELDHGGSVLVSWSLNAQEIAASEEHGAAPVHERLAAARSLINKGYRVGFHFDPLIYYPGWQEGYRQTVDLLADSIPPAAIAWISLGSLRFMPPLKNTSLQRFPHTKIYCQEFVSGHDGKMRYLQDIRLEMYTALVAWLRHYSNDIFIYYCMESPTVWKKTLGFAPSNAELQKLLDGRVSPRIAA